jgi:hypothetical protein
LADVPEQETPGPEPAQGLAPEAEPALAPEAEPAQGLAPEAEPAQGLAPEADREAAAELAELASALAGAAAAESGDSAGEEAAAVTAGRLGRLRPRRGRRAIAGWNSDARRGRVAAALLAVLLIVGFEGSTIRPAASTAAPSGRIAAASPTAAPSATRVVPTGSPAAYISPAPSPSPSPTPTPAALRKSPPATIRFLGLIVDPIVDSSGTVGSTRSFSFTSDGPGVVSAQIVAAAPTASTVLCVTMDEAAAVCDRGATPGVTQPATTAHSTWTVSLISPDTSTPTVDVEFTWPTDHPDINLSHSRFQGIPNPDSMRTLSATFKTRSAGDLGMVAVWEPTTLTATLTVSSLSGARATVLDSVDYTAQTGISPPYSYPLKAGLSYGLELQNKSPDSLRPILSATISFP